MSFKATKIQEINDCLWFSTIVKNNLYFGSYNIEEESKPQCYYKLVDGVLQKREIPNSENHRYTKVFNLNDHLYVITGGLIDSSKKDNSGALILVDENDSSPITGFNNGSILTATYFNGQYIICWKDFVSTKQCYLYNCPPSGNKTQIKLSEDLSDKQIVYHDSIVYDDYLYLSGCISDTYPQDSSYYNGNIITQISKNNRVVVFGKNVIEFSGKGLNTFQIFNDCLYMIDSGKEKSIPILYKYNKKTFVPIWSCNSSFFATSGGLSVYKNHLIIPVYGEESVDVYSLNINNYSKKILNNESFESFKPQETNVFAGSGYISNFNDKLYLTYVYNKNSTYLYEVEVKKANVKTLDPTKYKYDIQRMIIPPATVLVNEFNSKQDLDGNSSIYGYDFKISDDTKNKPPNKPIVLLSLENNQYWPKPNKSMTWKEYLNNMGYNEEKTK